MHIYSICVCSFFHNICCRRKVTYGQAQSGNVWRRQTAKRSIPCPLCPATTQWVSRHLRQCHKLSNENVQRVLGLSDEYRRNGAASQQSRQKCPVAGSGAYVIRMDLHLRRKHQSMRNCPETLGQKIVPRSTNNGADDNHTGSAVGIFASRCPELDILPMSDIVLTETETLASGSSDNLSTLAAATTSELSWMTAPLSLFIQALTKMSNKLSIYSKDIWRVLTVDQK